jgi:hypothetical protein
MDSTGPKPRRHVFGYLDETGLLHTAKTDRIFGIGLLVCPNARELHRAIIDLKNKRNYHHEFKSTDVTEQNLPVYKALIDVFFACTGNRFHVVIVDKRRAKLPKAVSHTGVYNKIAATLVAGSIDRASARASEYMTILADDVSTSKDDTFEKTIREVVKKRQRRNALFGIARLESHAVSEIQLVDVLLGLVAYAHKLQVGVVTKPKPAKLKLLKYLQKKLDVTELDRAQVIKVKRGEMFEILEWITDKQSK